MKLHLRNGCTMAIVGLGIGLLVLATDLASSEFFGFRRESLVLCLKWIVGSFVGGLCYTAFLPGRVRSQRRCFSRVRTATGAAAGAATVAVFTVVELILSRDFFMPREGLLLIIGVGAGFGCLAGFIASLVAGYPRGPARGTPNSHTPAGHHR